MRALPWMCGGPTVRIEREGPSASSVTPCTRTVSAVVVVGGGGGRGEEDARAAAHAERRSLSPKPGPFPALAVYVVDSLNAFSR